MSKSGTPEGMVTKSDYLNALNKFLDQKKNENVVVWDEELIQDYIRTINEYYDAEVSGAKRKAVHYNRVKRYDILRIDGKNRLIKKKKKGIRPNNSDTTSYSLFPYYHCCTLRDLPWR